MSKQSKNRNHAAPLCVYCQARPSSTRDHVVPECLYIPPLPPNVITVRSCLPCNQTKGVGDTDLRDYLIIDPDAGAHPAAHPLTGKVLRSLLRNSSPIARSAMNSVMEPLITDAGIYLGEFPTAEIDDRAMLLSLKMMVRGLTFHASKTYIPPDYQIHVARVPIWKSKGFLTKVFQRPPTGMIVQGERRFESAYWHDEGAPETVLWVLLFFDAALFYGYSVPLDFKLEKPQDIAAS